ncbi:MAG: DUF547 domain-containing protein [Planctomycetota bacterium]|jgi:hypothetical protein|nr:DUF547 domain-containing protein [Planctomycetota bacterium]
MRTVLLWAVLMLAVAAEQPVAPVPSGLDHSPYQELLQRYVNERGLIDYAGLAGNADDLTQLDAYLQAMAQPGQPATGAERVAALINAYNAITLRAVITLGVEAGESFWSHDPFDDRIYTIGGEAVSLDAIEHQALRPEAGYRVHAALVCAAMSCPPLWRQAFTASNLDAALNERFAVWLARQDLNHFDHSTNRLELSKIFSWFKADFVAAGGVTAVVARHAPPSHRAWLETASPKTRYLPYDKRLNAQ